MNNINYDDYNKITDSMYYLGNNINLNFNVILSRKTKSNYYGDRYFFHQEYRYPSKYEKKDTSISIKRSFSYYLSIDIGSDWKYSVMIRVQDILLFRSAINNASKWASDGTFGIKGRKKELVIIKKSETIKVDTLPENKYIWFDPVVIMYNDIYYPGIRMTISDESIYTDIVMDNFFGLVYLVNQLDMFGYAQNMLNYINRPNFGFNIHDISDENSFFEEEKERKKFEGKSVKAQTGRQLPGLKNKSAFDEMME